MTYVSWAALYEGATDQLYFDVLIPRIMDEMILDAGIRNSTIPVAPALLLRRGSADAIARELCASQRSFHIVFIHADTGGRAVERSIGERGGSVPQLANELCDWPVDRCILIAPRHEMEAWILADPHAVCDSLGYNGAPDAIGLPLNARAAERLPDPKAILSAAITQVRGRRGHLTPVQLFPAVAQRQSLDALRSTASFRQFEAAIAAALRSLGCIAP